MSIKIGINGFGRIGRCIFRLCQLAREGGDPSFDIVAINSLDGIDVSAHLLEFDSVHRRSSFKVKTLKSGLEINGKKVSFYNYKTPTDIPWGEQGVDVVLECTGVFRKKKEASKHLHHKVKKVVISAPSEDADITLVMGVNEKTYDASKHHIISNASCTTNCLAPLIKVLDEKFGVNSVFMSTIHSYTNDQNVLDLSHKDLRRARAAALSMIPTTSGATQAIESIFPHLKGHMKGLSIRVPTPDVSLIDIIAHLKKDVTKEAVNKAFENASHGALSSILGVESKPLVSVDYIGDLRSSIVDLGLTEVLDKRFVKVVSWYDNEMAFSQRMLDVAKFVCQ